MPEQTLPHWEDVVEAPDAFTTSGLCMAKLHERSRPIIGAPSHTHVCQHEAGHDELPALPVELRSFHECRCGLLWWHP